MSNTPTVITGEQLIREVRKLAAEQPDKIGSMTGGCRYFEEGPEEEPTDTPSCGVGHAFYNLGVRGLPESLECTIATFNRRIHLGLLGLPGRSLFRDLAGNLFKLDASVTEIKRLNNFQESQDSDEPWGEAVKELGAAYA